MPDIGLTAMSRLHALDRRFHTYEVAHRAEAVQGAGPLIEVLQETVNPRAPVEGLAERVGERHLSAASSGYAHGMREATLSGYRPGFVDPDVQLLIELREDQMRSQAAAMVSGPERAIVSGLNVWAFLAARYIVLTDTTANDLRPALFRRLGEELTMVLGDQVGTSHLELADEPPIIRTRLVPVVIVPIYLASDDPAGPAIARLNGSEIDVRSEAGGSYTYDWSMVDEVRWSAEDDRATLVSSVMTHMLTATGDDAHAMVDVAKAAEALVTSG